MESQSRRSCSSLAAPSAPRDVVTQRVYPPAANPDRLSLSTVPRGEGLQYQMAPATGSLDRQTDTEPVGAPGAADVTMSRKNFPARGFSFFFHHLAVVKGLPCGEGVCNGKKEKLQEQSREGKGWGKGSRAAHSPQILQIWGEGMVSLARVVQEQLAGACWLQRDERAGDAQREGWELQEEGEGRTLSLSCSCSSPQSSQATICPLSHPRKSFPGLLSCSPSPLHVPHHLSPLSCPISAELPIPQAPLDRCTSLTSPPRLPWKRQVVQNTTLGLIPCVCVCVRK